MGTSILEPNSYILGASAGVYALLTAHVADIILVSFFFFLVVREIYA
jgi:hypothetical protein